MSAEHCYRCDRELCGHISDKMDELESSPASTQQQLAEKGRQVKELGSMTFGGESFYKRIRELESEKAEQAKRIEGLEHELAESRQSGEQAARCYQDLGEVTFDEGKKQDQRIHDLTAALQAALDELDAWTHDCKQCDQGRALLAGSGPPQSEWMRRKTRIECPCDHESNYKCAYAKPAVWRDWPCPCVCHQPVQPEAPTEPQLPGNPRRISQKTIGHNEAHDYDKRD